MLFKIKNSLSGSLLLTFALFVAAVLLQQAMGLNWVITFDESTNVAGISTVAAIGISLVVLLIGDGVVNGILRGIYGSKFQSTFDQFLSQVVVGEWEVVLIVAVTAAAEEMFFRGVFIQGIIQYGWGPSVGVIFSSFIFNLAHYFKRPDLNWWLLTSIWEGLALGITYAMTGSLVTIMVVHAIHDVINGGVAIMLVRRMKK